MSYQYIDEDENTFKVRHPDGSEFHIAKHAVGPEVHKKIKALKMADGGKVPSSNQQKTKKEDVDKQLLEAEEKRNAVTNSMYGHDQSIAMGMAYGGKVSKDDVADPDPKKAQEMVKGATSSGANPGQWVKNIKDSLNMADGGIVPSEDEENDTAEETPTPSASAAPQNVDIDTNPSLPQSLVTNPQANVINSAPNQQIPSNTSMQQPAQQMAGPYEQAFAQKESGIQQAAGAQSEASKAQAKAYGDQAAALATQQQNYQDQYKQINDEHQELTKAIMNQKIDPMRMMTGWNRVVSAIAIGLSGIGSGLTGQRNLAMDVIQKDIDRDIESQKMELGKKHTLLSENMRRFGDLNAATQMTQLQLNASTQAQVMQAAAKAQSPQAQANAKMMLGELGLQAAQIKQQMALMGAQAKSYGIGGGGEGGIPVGQEPFQMLSDPKYQEKRVLVNGRAYQHTGKAEDAQNYRNVESVAGGVNDLVHQLDQLGPGALVPGTEANNKAQALRYQLSTEIPKLKSMQIGAKRVNETEAERAEKMISDPTAFRQLVNGGARNDVFFKTLNDELERSRKDNLIGYKGMSQYNFKPGI